jgi:hypothetical protein
MIEKVLGRMGVDVSWYLTPIEVAKERWRDEALGYTIKLMRGRKSETFIYRSPTGPYQIPGIEVILAKVLTDERATRIFYQAEIDELLDLIGETK